ncbi:hypothetical protein [Mesorhizobium sp. Cs1321R2N1]|uniref:hypothetical protein n=1 Tax=Mesorhizobium sp. Cs1321R2N1 TaxID=3015174 RepID=UPI00301CCC4B
MQAKGCQSPYAVAKAAKHVDQEQPCVYGEQRNLLRMTATCLNRLSFDDMKRRDGCQIAAALVPLNWFWIRDALPALASDRVSDVCS